MDDLQENNIRTEEQKVKRLPLISDYVFKRIFAREENNSMLKDFLESILNIHINKVEVKNPELTPNMADEKLGILDLKLDIDNERVVDVEMQVSNEHNIKERSSTLSLSISNFKSNIPSFSSAILGVNSGFFTSTLFICIFKIASKKSFNIELFSSLANTLLKT